MYAMFVGLSSFNQDLSSWSVENVTSCSRFSEGASTWTLPQPNFTNCNPN
jgi:surface protein